MADPSVKTIQEWVWLKVATNVVTGMIHRLNAQIDYYQTYRLTGGGAPTAPTAGTLPTEAAKMFTDVQEEPIRALAGIDVYIMGADRDDTTSNEGSIRVDV